MIEYISTHILDLLAGSATLYAGGNAYAAGWTGKKRPDAGVDSATAGYVNLFDRPHSADGRDHRPGIYLGMKDLEAYDEREFDVQSGSGGTELRMARIPLVICVIADTETDAKRQRNQLRNNVRKVLQPYRVAESGYWYWMETALGGVPAQNRVWTSSSGAGSQQAAEGMAVVMVEVHYSWNVSCNA